MALTRFILCLLGGQFSATVARSILQNCKRISGKLGAGKGLLFLSLFTRDGSMPLKLETGRTASTVLSEVVIMMIIIIVTLI